MLVKNISARLHHVGNVSIAPGEQKEIDKSFYDSINKSDLVAVALVLDNDADIVVVPKKSKGKAQFFDAPAE